MNTILAYMEACRWDEDIIIMNNMHERELSRLVLIDTVTCLGHV